MTLLAFDRYGGAYATAGPRPTTVLLHGFLGSARNLASLARGWAAREPDLVLLVADLLGHGRSPPLPESPTLEALADSVLALSEAHCPDAPVELVGHSLGGRVALAALASAPERIASVSLLDIAPGPVDRGLGITARALDLLVAAPDAPSSRDPVRAHLQGGGLPTAIVEWLLMNLVPDGASLRWRIDRAALRAAWPHLSAQDLWSVVARYPGRLVCIRGGASDYVSDTDVARWETLGAPPVVTLAGAGHFLHVDALPGLLAQLAPIPAG